MHSTEQSELALGDPSQTDEPLIALWKADPLLAFEKWRKTMLASNMHAFSERSIEQHTAMWAHFLDYLATRKDHIQTVQSDVVEAFLKQLRGRPVKSNDRSRLPLTPGEPPPASHSTIGRYTKLLMETFNLLRELKIRQGNPVAPLVNIHTKPQAPPGVDFLSRDQEKALLCHIAGLPVDDWKSERDRALLYLLLASGPTVGELIRLRIDDLSTGDDIRSIHIPSHDLTHAHAAPIAPFAIEALVKWKERRLRALTRCEAINRQSVSLPAQDHEEEAIPGSILFPSTSNGASLESSVVYNIVRHALDAIEFPGKSRGPQTLRNTFARRQLYNNANPEEVSRWLGLITDKTVKKLLRTLPGTKTSTVF